jgi:hypothetical protein
MAAISLVKGIGAASEARSLNEAEILATLATCKCGEIYEQYMRCADGKIRKRGVCPDCQRKILDDARSKRGPGAPRMTAAKRKRIAAESERLEAENLSLRERLEKAKAKAEAAAERGTEPFDAPRDGEPERPAPVRFEPTAAAREQSAEGVVTLDLRPYPTLLEEIKLLAIEDVRSVEQEAIWILMDYARTVRTISKEVLDRAKESRGDDVATRGCKYRI